MLTGEGVIGRFVLFLVEKLASKKIDEASEWDAQQTARPLARR